MTLLLGPPGAGKSTLLKALSGKLVGPKVRARVSELQKGSHGISCEVRFVQVMLWEALCEHEELITRT